MRTIQRGMVGVILASALWIIVGGSHGNVVPVVRANVVEGSSLKTLRANHAGAWSGLFNFSSTVTATAGGTPSAHPAATRGPLTATGTFTILTDTFTPTRTADGDTFFDEVATLQYAGDLTGMATDTDTFVLHSDGSLEGHGIEVCTSCTIGGRTGDFTSVFVFAGSFTTSEGALVFTRGSGGLAGLHGGGTFLIPTTGASTYVYKFQFEP